MNATRRLVLVGAGWALLGVAPLAAQSVRGRVLNDETGLGIGGVRVTLVTAAGTVVAEVISRDDGLFQLAAKAAGEHRLVTSHIAYRTTTTDAFRIQDAEQVVVDVRLSQTAIPLETLTITARRSDPRRDATFEGFYARQLSTPPLGSSRVITRIDAEMVNARDARDVLAWFPPSRFCLVLYVNGTLIMQPETAAMWLETQTGHLEGIEYYRYLTDAPPSMRDVPAYLLSCPMHSVLALWSYTGYYGEPPADLTPSRRRVHVAAGVYRLSGRYAPGTGAGLEAAAHWPVGRNVALGMHVRQSAHRLPAATAQTMLHTLGQSPYVMPTDSRPLGMLVIGLEPRLLTGPVAGVWPFISARVQLARRELTLQTTSTGHEDVPIVSWGRGAGATVGAELIVKRQYAFHAALGYDFVHFSPYYELERRWNPTSANWTALAFRVGFGYALER